MADARVDLEDAIKDPEAAGLAATPETSSRRSFFAGVLVATLVVGVIAVLLYFLTPSKSVPALPMRFSIELSPTQRLWTRIDNRTLSLSPDGRKLVFSYHDDPRAGSDSFHIWEINADGTGLRQLTSGPYHDGSPAYLPDGRIVFTSTRVESFSRAVEGSGAASPAPIPGPPATTASTRRSRPSGGTDTPLLSLSKPGSNTHGIATSRAPALEPLCT